MITLQLRDANFVSANLEKLDKAGRFRMSMLKHLGKTVKVTSVLYRDKNLVARIDEDGSYNFWPEWLFVSFPKFDKPKVIKFKNPISDNSEGKISMTGALEIGCETVSADQIAQIYKASQQAVARLNSIVKKQSVKKPKAKK